MSIEYRKAAPDMLALLVRTRIEVLRAANQLDEDADLSEVAAQSRYYYQTALADGTHAGYLAFDGPRFVGTGGVSYYRVMPTCHNPTGRKAYIMNMYVRPRCITLEATPAGRPLYEHFGFVAMKNEMELPDGEEEHD